MEQQIYRAVAVGRGGDWIGEGWKLFRPSPGLWIGMVLIWVLVLGALGAAPLIGPLASNLLGPVFTAGVFFGCLRVERGGTLQLEDLFSAFKSDRLGPLVLVGLFGLLLVMVIVLIAVVFGFGAAASFMSGAVDELGSVGVGTLVGALFVLLLLLPVAMALWFAAPLVALARVEPIESLKLSFAACWANIWSLSWWGLLALLVMIVAAIPLFLGWLVAGPVLMASYYCMYRDIFADAVLPEAA